jgi:autotransporter-associated beta strand protein
VTLNPISGAGDLQQFGTGVTSINGADTYTGGTTISAGVLAIGDSGVLGTGSIALSGGELLTTANATLVNMLAFSGTSTIAAAHGTTLNENASSYVLDTNAILNIGSPGQDGTILWHTNPGSFGSGAIDGVRVQAGTLRAADDSFSLLVEEGSTTTVDAGATVDVAGFNSDIFDLEGAGAVTNSGASASLALFAANFSGTILGSLSLVFEGNAALSGLEDYTGDATLAGLGVTVTLANTGAYDLIANGNIDGPPTSVFLNSGLFEKTGLNGVSAVTTTFINAVSPNPGTAWKAIGTGDFNDDGHSDILFQNTTSGQVSIWEMNGNNVTGGGTVGADPGSSWRAIGTGDFNDDGHSDILFQNANRQASIWDMSGTSLVGGGAVSPNPGSSWRAVA